MKVDTSSRNERGFLGINIQYIQEGCLRLRTLAVKELFERHTGNEIKRCILDELESFLSKYYSCLLNYNRQCFEYAEMRAAYVRGNRRST